MPLSKVVRIWVEGEPSRAPEPQSVHDEVYREALHDWLEQRDIEREPRPTWDEL